jgi:3-methylcrotonyl-CoA carboxylase alpha subunit
VVAGPRTNLGFLTALCRAPAFRAGRFDTGFIEAHLTELGAEPRGLDRVAAALAAKHLAERAFADQARAQPRTDGWVSPWEARDDFQLAGRRQISLSLVADGERVTAMVMQAGGLSVSVDGVAPGDGRVIDAGDTVYVLRGGRQTVVRLQDYSAELSDAGGDGAVRAPMHGKVLAILVDCAAAVRKGQRVAIIEAMKMEHALTAPHDGTVAEIAVGLGAQVAEGALLMHIKKED